MRTPCPFLPVLFLATAAAQQAADGDGAPPARPVAPLVTSYAAAMVGAPPATLGLDPFYAKHVDAMGIPVVASAQVDDAALLLARDIVDAMLTGRPDVRREMIARKYRVAVIAKSEGQTDLPEHRNMRKPQRNDRRLTPQERARYDQPGGIAGMTDQEYWNQRARGLGGPLTSCGEENLLGIPGTRYFGEHILVHEFSHAVMSALRTADPDLFRQIHEAYTDAKAKGRFKGHYAETTADEFWAEGTQWWFGSNYEWADGEQRLRTADDLAAYDPRLFELLGKVYVGHRIAADVYSGRDLRPARR